jgi:TP901 family phage tail tape measure protein
MRAQMLLTVRDKLTGKLKKTKAALKGVTDTTRRLRGGMSGAEAASRRMGSAQARAAQDTRRANRTYQQQERILGRLERRERSLRNARLGRAAGIAAGGATATLAGTAITRASLRPAGQFGTFDEQADAVSAIARVKAGSAQDKLLRNNARELGASTSFSAIQASQGQEFLAMAGFDPDAIVASMRSVLELAKAGRVEIGTAADISSDVGSAFGIEKTAAGMGRLSDVFVGVTTRANTNVEMLGETMKYAAPFAKAFGASLEVTSAMAGVMADNGVKGSQAGTALSATFARLASPPKEAADALKQLGVRTRDASGNMLPIVDILGQIKKATDGMGTGDRTAILSKIAGLEASKGFLNVVSNLDRVVELTKELENSKGEANRVSEAMGDNLPGDLKSARSALAELGLVIGEQVEPYVRSLVKWVTKITRKVTAWAKENPGLVRGLGSAAVALGALLTVGGALATVLGAILVPLALMRFSLSMMSMNALRAGKSVRGLRGGFLGLGRMKPLRWARLIPKIGWLALAGALIWGLLVSDINWRDFLSPVKWREWIGNLDWTTVLTVLSIASFILPFSWVKVVGRLSWKAFITPLKWASMLPKLSWRLLIPALKWGGRFIPVIGWAAVAGSLAWSLIIKPLGWDQYLNLDKLKSGLNKAKNWISEIMGVDPNRVKKQREANPEQWKKTPRGWRRTGVSSNKPANIVKKPSAALPEPAKQKPAVKIPVPTQRPIQELKTVTQEVEKVKATANTLPPAVKTATSQSEAVLQAINWTTHGQRMMQTLAQGVTNGGALVKAAVAAELAKARALLPSSNAKEGPLSNLTGNGASILATMAQGVKSGGDGGLARSLGAAIGTAPALLPQLAANGAAVGNLAASQPQSSQGAQQPSGGNSFGNIIFNIYPQSGDDGAKQIEDKMRQIMHEKLND